MWLKSNQFLGINSVFFPIDCLRTIAQRISIITSLVGCECRVARLLVRFMNLPEPGIELFMVWKKLGTITPRIYGLSFSRVVELMSYQCPLLSTCKGLPILAGSLLSASLVWTVAGFIRRSRSRGARVTLSYYLISDEMDAPNRRRNAPNW